MFHSQAWFLVVVFFWPISFCTTFKVRFGTPALFYLLFFSIMALVNNKLISLFKKVWHQASQKDPVFVCKFYDPSTQWSWYATDYNDETKSFFGYVNGDYSYWWYFSLNQLEKTKRPFSSQCRIQRDEFFKPTNYSALFREQKKDSSLIRRTFLYSMFQLLIVIVQLGWILKNSWTL